MPTPEQVKQNVAGVFDRAAATYDQTGPDYFTTFGRIVVAAAALQPGERVLDIGSGRGAVLLPAAAAVGPDGRVDGVDLAPGMVSLLSADIARLGVSNASVVLGDAETPPVTGTYDVVVSGLVLFFLPDPAAALRGYRRLLRADGRLAFSSFSRDDDRWGPVYRLIGAFVPPDESPLPRPADADGPFASDLNVTELVTAAGFVDVGNSHHPHVTSLASKEDWWTWAWSHGMRGRLERIPPEQLDDTKDAIYQAIDDIAEPDGSVTVRMSIRVTTARTPA